MRQKRDISEHRSNLSSPTLTLFATRPLAYCVTSKGLSYTKNEYNLFYHTSNAEYFFIRHFFQKKKKTLFWENREKLFWRHIWRFFRERGRPAPKIKKTFFYHKLVANILLFNSFFFFFSKKSCIFRENGEKPLLGAYVSSKEKGASGDENEKNLYGKCGFQYFFEESNIPRENGGKKFLEDTTIF